MQGFEQHGGSRFGGPLHFDSIGPNNGGGGGGRGGALGTHVMDTYAVPPAPLHQRSMMPPPTNGMHSGLHRPPANDMKR